MNREIRDRWVAALRSGTYKQGRSMLKVDAAYGETRHCCLGVLCEIALESGVQVELDLHHLEDGSVAHRYDGQQGYPPRSIIDWADLGHGEVRYDEGWTNLYQLNDSLKMSFREIADIIEEQM